MRRRIIFYHVVPFVLALFLALFGATITLWPNLGIYEGHILPVVDKFETSDAQPHKGGMLFYVSFTKLRNCEFVGINWYKNSTRLLVEFAPDAQKFMYSRPVGAQTAGPWMLHNTTSLKGTVAEVVHQCHPFWKTVTHLYP